MGYAFGADIVLVINEILNARHSVTAHDVVALFAIATITGYVLCAFALLESAAPRCPPCLAERSTNYNNASGGVHLRGPALLATHWSSLRHWIESDEEISDPAFDAFGHDIVAERMVRRLTQDPASTMVLIGRRGSGKTSIRKLVERRLFEAGTTQAHGCLLVSVSLWPFDSIHSAARGILDAIVRTLATEVDVGHITGVPDEYVEAISYAEPSVAAALRLASPGRDPEAIIERIATVAQTIRRHVVVWIEDIERFTPQVSPTQSIPDSDRLGPIRSLLYLLDRCDALSVVVAAESIDCGIDLEKIARYVEHTPRLDPQDNWRIISFFRHQLRSPEHWPIIDPASASARQILDSPDDETLMGFALMDLGSRNPRRCLANSVPSPRLLKHALRFALDRWKQLAGEVDVDDVLVMSVIRSVSPVLFSFIDRNIDSLQHDHRPIGMDKEADEQRAALKDGLRRAAASVQDVAMQAALLQLVETVFPTLKASSHKKPQGFASDGPRDYWSRFSSCVRPSSRESDQEVLRSIQAWRKYSSKGLVEQVCDPQRGDPIVAFATLCEPHELIRLLREVTEAESARQRAAWPSSSPSGLISVRAMMNKVKVDTEILTCTIVDLVLSFGPSNLSLGYAFESWFAERAGGPPAILDQAQSARVRVALVEVLVQFSDEQLLIEALRGAEPYLLYWCSWGLDRIRKRQLGGLPFDGWEEVADVLLRAGRRDARIVVPQVLAFVVHEDVVGGEEPGSTQRVARFDAEIAERLFGCDHLARMLCEGCIHESWDSGTQAAYTATVNGLGLRRGQVP